MHQLHFLYLVQRDAGLAGALVLLPAIPARG